MPYLVRKIIKKPHVENIKEIDNNEEIGADIITTEFRTKNNTLSTWYIDELSGESLNEAILAIAITSSKLERMDFIIIDTDFIIENKLTYMQTDTVDPMPIENFEKMHNDITNITLCKLNNMVQLYKDVYNSNNELVKRYTKPEVKKIVENALQRKRVKLENVNKDLRDEIIEINSKLSGQASEN